MLVKELKWEEATIEELRCTAKRAAYRVRSTTDSKDVFILEDSDRFVREYTEPGSARLMQSVRCGDGAEHVNSLCAQYAIDIGMIGKSLLLCAASSGNVAVAKWLINTCNVDYLSKDENGRNMLHLALMNKQFTFIESLPQCQEASLTTPSDSKGFNIFHFLVMSKNTALTKGALYERKFDFEVYGRGSTTEQRVVKLVDLHGERFGSSAPRSDTRSVVSPLDWAQRTKQFDMVDILQKYLHELHIDRLMWDLNRSSDNCSDEQLLLKLKHIREKIASFNLELVDVTHVGEFFVTMFSVKQSVLKNGLMKSLLYMERNFALEALKRACDPYKVAVIDIGSAIEGPEAQSFWPQEVGTEVKDISPASFTAAAAFNFVAPGFNHAGGENFADYLEKKICGWEYEGVCHRCYEGLSTGFIGNQESMDQWLSKVGDWMKDACEYTDKFILRARGVLVKERIAIIEYVRNNVPAHSPRAELPPQLFVHHGQLQLLQWAVAKKYVDLSAPAALCEELVGYVDRLPWLSLINTKKKKKKKKSGAAVDPTVIPPHLTVGEVLCALAAGWGEYLILRWLLEECIPREKYGMCIGGQSLVLIAAKQNRAIIIEYFVSVSVVNAALSNAFFFQFVEAARESCQHGYYVTGLMMICNCSIDDPLWESIYGIAAKAPNTALRHWAYATHAAFETRKLIALLDTTSTFKEIVEHFDQCDYFANDFFSLMELNCSVEKVHEDGELIDAVAVTDQFAALMLLSCHAVQKRSLALLKHILASVASHCPFNHLQKFTAELVSYAQSQGNTAAVEVLNAALQASERFGALLLSDVERMLTEGAPIAQVEALLNSAPTYGDGSMQARFAHLVNDEREVLSWLKGPATQGHLHYIKWLIEVAQLRPTFAAASKLCIAAVRGVHLPLVKYFLNEVLLRPKRLQPSEEPGANISSSALATLFDKIFVTIFKGMDALEKDVLDAVAPLFEMLHSVLHDAVKFKLAINVEILLKKIIKHTHWNDSERWWEVLRWVLSVEAYQTKFTEGDGFLSDVVGLATMSARHFVNTTKLLHFLIDNGANATLEMERVVVSCQRIWKHHEPHSFVVILKCFAARGINIQGVTFGLDYISANEQDAARVATASIELEALKAEQRKCWTVAEAISAGRSIEFLQGLVMEDGAAPVHSMRDRQGHDLLQVAALSNRGDVILWLKETHGMDITTVDAQGLTLLQLCRRAGSLQAARLIEESVFGDKVRAFCQRHFHRRRILRLARAEQSRRTSSALLLQSRLRGWGVRRRYAPLLQEVKGTYEAFTSKWGGVLSALKAMKTHNNHEFSWAEQKFKFDMAVDAQDEDVENVREFAHHAAAAQVVPESSPAELEFSTTSAARDLSAVRGLTSLNLLILPRPMWERLQMRWKCHTRCCDGWRRRIQRIAPCFTIK